MERVLFVVAMIFAAGCGGDGIPAPSACPIAKGDFTVSAYVSAAPDLPGRARALLFGAAKPEHTNSRPVRLQIGESPRGHLFAFAWTEIPEHGELLFFASGEAYDGAEIPGPEQLVELNRNCDLLAEIGLTPEGDELTMDLRWIERAE